MEVAYDDEALAAGMRYLANHARQPVEPRAVLRYEVTGDGPYVVREEGDLLATLAGADDVLFVLYRRCHARLLDHLALGSWAALHGGVVSVRGRRALVVGHKGAGKTTLLLRLLYDGHEVEGDEMVFTRDGEAVCLPRNFHLKPGTAELVPDIAAGFGGLPTTATTDGALVTAFDPGAAGFDWRLELAAVERVFVLRPDHGGRPGCRQMSGVELTRAVVEHAFPLGSSRPDLLRACALLVGDVDGCELTVAALGPTAALLVDACG